jgi:ribosomal protein S18 acetylase RimI-like enzyme
MNKVLPHDNFFYKEISSLSNVDAFVNIIFLNFPELIQIEKLKHTKEQIKKLLTSNKMNGFLVYNKKGVLIAYIIGELINLNDRRTTFYISYLYVANKYRKKGIAKKLMSLIVSKCRKIGIRNITLTVDTDNKSIYDFYLKWGFMPDQILRTYDKYDVLTLNL